ncbi:hypothetical protein BDZ97DRAFT_1763881 [Flammula alnicola]|nr:hypothetical protein BDZ97DRAFT_1763881 [Flammula alnicola]
MAEITTVSSKINLLGCGNFTCAEKIYISLSDELWSVSQMFETSTTDRSVAGPRFPANRIAFGNCRRTDQQRRRLYEETTNQSCHCARQIVPRQPVNHLVDRARAYNVTTTSPDESTHAATIHRRIKSLASPLRKLDAPPHQQCHHLHQHGLDAAPPAAPLLLLLIWRRRGGQRSSSLTAAAQTRRLRRGGSSTPSAAAQIVTAAAAARPPSLLICARTTKWVQWQQQNRCCCQDMVMTTPRCFWDKTDDVGSSGSSTTAMRWEEQQHDSCCSNTATAVRWGQRQHNEMEATAATRALLLLPRYGSDNEGNAGSSDTMTRRGRGQAAAGEATTFSRWPGPPGPRVAMQSNGPHPSKYLVCPKTFTAPEILKSSAEKYSVRENNFRAPKTFIDSPKTLLVNDLLLATSALAEAAETEGRV